MLMIIVGGAIVWGLVWHALAHLPPPDTGLHPDIEVLLRAALTSVVALVITALISIGGDEAS